MTISIIVPIYNVEKYIGRCLDSIFVQEYNGVDIECILVNDCTPDNSMDIVAKKLEFYHGKIIFKIKNLDKNGGLCMARNAGVEIAKGEYVLFVDSDDRLLPDSDFTNHEYQERGRLDNCRWRGGATCATGRSRRPSPKLCVL